MFWSSYIYSPWFYAWTTNLLCILQLKLSVQIHQFYEMRLFTEATNQAKPKKKCLATLIPIWKFCIRTDSNVLKYLIPLPLFRNACARVYVLYTSHAASEALHICVYVCLRYSVVCLPNSTHWNPITNRCCAFYCRCGSVNGIACRMLYIRTSWPIRTCDCPLPLKWTNYLLYYD